MAIDKRNCFWFGTEDRAEFFATPLQGADSSPSAWAADGTLLNGGGWALNSWGSHKRYTYEWPASSSRETAQKMKSYRDGTYGRGLLYFLEPTIFTTNVLPASWADPSMALDNEAPTLVYGVDPLPVITSGGENLGLPVSSAQYVLTDIDLPTTPSPDSSVFIPVPTGHTLFLGAFYTSTGSGAVFATPVNSNGTFGTAVKLTEKSNADTDVVTDQFSGSIRGVRIWVGKTTTTSSSVTIAAMAGRLIETTETSNPSKVAKLVSGPWVGGQGHSGCRFLGTPTYVTNSPIEGGRVGFAATFVETGSWAFG